MKLHVICVFLACVSLVWSNPLKECDEIPGLTVRMQNKFLDSMKGQVLNSLNKYITPLPNLMGESHIKLSGYGIKTVKFTSLDFDFGNFDIVLSPPNILVLNLTNASVSFTNDWELETSLPHLPHLINRSISARLDGFKFLQSVQLRQNADGNLELNTTSCRTFVEQFKLNIKRIGISLIGISIIYIQRGFEAIICPYVKFLVTTQLNRFLANNNIKYITENGNNLKRRTLSPINVHLESVCDPMTTDEDLTIYLKGIASPNGYLEQAFPFEVSSRVPKLTPTSQLTRASISEYSINTMLYSMWLQNWLDQTFSSMKVVLATGKTLAVYLSAISLDFKRERRPMLIKLRALKAPVSQLTRNTLVLSGYVSLSVDIKLENGELKKAIDDVVTDFSVTSLILTKNHMPTSKITVIPIEGFIAQNVNNYSLKAFLWAVLQLLLEEITEMFPFPESVKYKPANPSPEIKEGALEVGM